MEFYKDMSGFYREIFPLNPDQVQFTKDAFPQPSDCSLLDVGCGTGDLVRELSGSFGHVTGIDLDGDMIAHAEKPLNSNVVLKEMNMLHLSRHFSNSRFDGLLCYGNTLVHLENLKVISTFIQQTRQVLKENGTLLLQIINYDRILDLGVDSLPTIDTENYRFERNYQYLPNEHLIDFITMITIKETGQQINNSIQLYPLRSTELHTILNETGFNSVSTFGNFQKAPFEEDSIPLVVKATR